ncbi:MAG: ribonuclease HII [Parcubacteria group bacterium]|jgi:ribonuclease HII
MKKQSISKILKTEQKYLDNGYDFVIGIDEAGRGPLAGPVVACAVCYRNGGSASIMEAEPPKRFESIKDSKKLSEKQREELYDFIHEHFHVGIGICDHKTIDRINILEATYLSMKKALTFLTSDVRMNKMIVLVDGNKVIPNCSYEQKAIVNGDNIVKSISAASIIAKVTRDRMMKKMHDKYPKYNFASHKGYGTKLHMEMIKKHGACEIHRKSFRPCNLKRVSSARHSERNRVR